MILPAEALERHPRTVVHPHWASRPYVIVGWPAETFPGLLQSVLAHRGPVDVAIHIEPVTGSASRRLQRLRALHGATIRADRKKGRITEAEIEVAEEDATTLARDLARGRSRLLSVGITANVTGRDEAHADEEAARFVPRLSSLLLTARPTTFRALRGWLSSLPLGLDLLGIRKTLDTASTADLFPFGTGEIEGHSGMGVLVGENVATGSPIMIDRWSLPAPNAAILGPSGVGKTFLASLLIARSALQGDQVCVVDPSVDGDLAAFVDRLGGIVATEPSTRPEGPVFCWRLAGRNRRTNLVRALETAWAHVSQGGRRRQIVVDEGHHATREHPAATALLWEIIKEGRHVRCGTTLVTQDISDLLSGARGEPLITNCSTVFLLRQAPKALATLETAFGLSAGEVRFLRSATPGQVLEDGSVLPAEVLLLAGDERARMRVVSTEHERSLIVGGPEGGSRPRVAAGFIPSQR